MQKKRKKIAILLVFQYQEDPIGPELSSPPRFRFQGGQHEPYGRTEDKGRTEIPMSNIVCCNCDIFVRYALLGENIAFQDFVPIIFLTSFILVDRVIELQTRSLKKIYGSLYNKHQSLNTVISNCYYINEGWTSHQRLDKTKELYMSFHRF